MKGLLKPRTILLVAIVGVMVYFYFPRAAGTELVPWRRDLTAAQAEAHAAHKPILIDFTAKWCGPCRNMSADVWADSRTASALKDWVPVQIDIDEQRALAEHYRVDAIPTLMALDDTGRVMRSTTGGMSRSEFMSWLEGQTP